MCRTVWVFLTILLSWASHDAGCLSFTHQQGLLNRNGCVVVATDLDPISLPVLIEDGKYAVQITATEGSKSCDLSLIHLCLPVLLLLLKLPYMHTSLFSYRLALTFWRAWIVTLVRGP